MDEHVAFRVKLRGLFTAFQRLDFRQNMRHQSACIEQIEAAQP